MKMWDRIKDEVNKASQGLEAGGSPAPETRLNVSLNGKMKLVKENQLKKPFPTAVNAEFILDINLKDLTYVLTIWANNFPLPQSLITVAGVGTDPNAKNRIGYLDTYEAWMVNEKGAWSQGTFNAIDGGRGSIRQEGKVNEVRDFRGKTAPTTMDEIDRVILTAQDDDSDEQIPSVILMEIGVKQPE